MTTLCEARQIAVMTARGHPDIERSPFDAYLLEKEDGTWQAEAAGLVVCSGVSFERAELATQEFGAGRPVWLVERGEAAVLLSEAT